MSSSAYSRPAKAGSGRGCIRFQPISRMNAVMVVTKNAEIAGGDDAMGAAPRSLRYHGHDAADLSSEARQRDAGCQDPERYFCPAIRRDRRHAGQSDRAGRGQRPIPARFARSRRERQRRDDGSAGNASANRGGTPIAAAFESFSDRKGAEEATGPSSSAASAAAARGHVPERPDHGRRRQQLDRGLFQPGGLPGRRASAARHRPAALAGRDRGDRRGGHADRRICSMACSIFSPARTCGARASDKGSIGLLGAASIGSAGRTASARATPGLNVLLGSRRCRASCSTRLPRSPTSRCSRRPRWWRSTISRRCFRSAMKFRSRPARRRSSPIRPRRSSIPSRCATPASS